MKTLLMAVAVAGMLGSGAAMAADGNKLLLQCQSLMRTMEGQASPTYGDGHCLGVVQGITDMLVLYQDKLPQKFCIPENVTDGQGVRIAVKYMEETPKLLNNMDTTLVLAAYADAYPCK